jgi:hypothetical protein
MSNQTSNSKPWYEKVSTQMVPTSSRKQTGESRQNSGRSQRNNNNNSYNRNSNGNYNKSRPLNFSQELSSSEFQSSEHTHNQSRTQSEMNPNESQNQNRNNSRSDTFGKSITTGKRPPSDFWNIKAVDYLIQELKAEPQIPFKPVNQNTDQIVVDSLGQTVQSGKRLPDHLLDLGVPKEYLAKTIIYQVDTNYSAWHSILALIHPEYGVLDYDSKRVMVMRLRDVVNNDFINNPSLRDKVVKHGLRMVHVENSINQDKIQDEILLRFFSLYFDANIYLVTEDSCYVFHEGQTFSGKLMNPLSISNDKNTIQMSYNPYKSSFLLYRFPFGNVAPVVQEGRTSQILSSTTDEVFVMAMVRNLSSSKQETNVSADKVSPQSIVITSETAAIKTEASKKAEIKKAENKEIQKDKFLSTLLKLKWEELAEIAEKEQIKPMQPAVKGYDGWKKKTKAQLAEELWQLTEANA